MDVNQHKIEDSMSESTSSPPSLAFLTSKSKPPTQEPIVLAADAGTTGHFVQKPQHLSHDGPIFNVQQTAIPISVTLPDNSTMTNTHEATLRLPGVSPSASKACIFNAWHHRSYRLGSCVTMDALPLSIRIRQSSPRTIPSFCKVNETPQRNCGW